ncbi:DNA-processing protein A/Predicted Rossmann fold nucleotide-binding protein DprA/Smf involved in DNA uptake [Halomicronema hongdechloris C2206]|uniref:DNA-processing protein A/Predicted Rossmann fold nucleotide-binding protein DprA/Smf involved in DNA uptake n=1 Tax=Halomicronema hongdechloris C2206 TaxID=1641165 RepID=A0A1Z3HHK0_9CYAN|nr:DNA-processing protein DprA [Halomicronema hongdechloris]ASC69687.1 DNA-processing protein A/Predicted Rossmann fold nucleotide-binding protein DprA/Smf involved in DNA uptake [Halomicronema hongdechloris C2206]
MTNERAYWLAWSTLPGLGPVLLKRLYYHCGSLAIAWQTPVPELLAVDGIGPQLGQMIQTKRPHLQPEKLLAQQKATQFPFITPADPLYPQILFEIADPPPVIYYSGQIELLSALQYRPAIGIVGTRSPSEYGKRWTRRLSAQLARQGFTIVSGLAEGIDREAHQACLQQRGHTLAVLGTGLDVVYPRANQGLYHQIKAEGLLLSEYPQGTPPERSQFPRRNRIIAGLCRALLVTEAPHRSGALITARLASEYGRDVYALPGSLDNPHSRGCLRLIRDGSQLILDEETLLADLGTIPPLDAVPSAAAATLQLPEPLQPIFAALSLEAMSLDALVQEVQLPPEKVLSALTQLEVMGVVMQLPGSMLFQRYP